MRDTRRREREKQRRDMAARVHFGARGGAHAQPIHARPRRARCAARRAARKTASSRSADSTDLRRRDAGAGGAARGGPCRHQRRRGERAVHHHEQCQSRRINIVRKPRRRHASAVEGRRRRRAGRRRRRTIGASVGVRARVSMPPTVTGLSAAHRRRRRSRRPTPHSISRRSTARRRRRRSEGNSIAMLDALVDELCSAEVLEALLVADERGATRTGDRRRRALGWPSGHRRKNHEDVDAVDVRSRHSRAQSGPKSTAT